MISEITAIPELQYDPHYFGGGTHENLHGQGLSPHVDFNFHPVTRQHRRLNMIFYLSPEWNADWGGSIQLHRDPYSPPAEDDIVTITPAFNRCVIFETNEYSWHGFQRIELPQEQQQQSRKSFALYFYTDSRPVEETVDAITQMFATHGFKVCEHGDLEPGLEKLAIYCDAVTGYAAVASCLSLLKIWIQGTWSNPRSQGINGTDDHRHA